MKPIDYAKASCETMMRKFAAPELPPKGHFHYHQGVFLSGVLNTWELTGDDRYFQYAKAWIDSVFDENGHMKDAHPGELDDIQPGILLYPIWDKTQDDYYRRCIESVRESVRAVPLSPEGAYWHKPYTKNQMWLDSLYMGGPFTAEYAARFDDKPLHESVVLQAVLMEKHTRDEKTGLFCHAWDGEKGEAWADPETGRSPEFWGRAMGWVPVALLNDLDFFDPAEPGAAELKRIAVELLTSLCAFQSEDGRWYQVVDKVGQPGNWPENSCSCLYTAGLCKAMRKGLLPLSYWANARRGYEGVNSSLEWAGEDLLIGNVCIGTGVGDYKHYCERPVSVNDLHGVGAYLIMCTEVQRLLNEHPELAE